MSAHARYARAGARQPSRRSTRGFTLIELLVAVVAGMFVVIAAFLLSKGATRLFASEGRVGQAQMGLRLGVERLRSDLERAGFQSTPNVMMDPDVCPNPNSVGFAAHLQSVAYLPGGSTKATQSFDPNNKLAPDAILLSGNFVGSDVYLVSDIEPSPAGGYDIFLQRNNGAVQRLLATGETGTTANVMNSTFPAGHLLRVTNPLGSSQFLLIDSSSIGSGGIPQIHLLPIPNLRVVDPASPDKRCGISGYGMGSTVNTVSTVKYDLRSTAAFAPWAYDPEGGVGETLKYDLVRTEMNYDGTEATITPPGGGAALPASSIISEYAVDLAFAFSVDTSLPAGASWVEPTMKSYDFGDDNNRIVGADVVTNAATARPQRIRTIKFRLTTRQRDADRQSNADDGGAGLMRYYLAPNQYARARTVVGEISLINQQGVRW